MAVLREKNRNGECIMSIMIFPCVHDCSDYDVFTILL